MTLTPKQLHILQHSLGVDKYGQGNQYRNRFVTGPGSDDFADCRALADAGLMTDHGAREIFGGDHHFTITPAGIDAVASQSPKPPKVNRSKERSKERYRQFLRQDTGESFRTWLLRNEHNRKVEREYA
ncbi:hypothetical protein Ga0100231_023865 [Opitutaceae bacterium TAV4]|nr:hypothetical protein Ga0100231_023865 [Opitutaceae bacterium TAV4]RRK00749.1 hypothetical protein Ga0100230_023440 [Opitutaceae bacterium TAV3]